MTWPTTPIGTTNIDAGTDSPATARADLKSAVDAVNSMIGMGDPFALHGRLIGVQRLTGSGTYTPTLGATAFRAILVGAGSGSSGRPSSSASQVAYHIPGNCGGYLEFYAYGFAGTLSYSVGSGGAGGAAGANAGGSGGATSLGGLAAAGGPNGGALAALTASAAAVLGGGANYSNTIPGSFPSSYKILSNVPSHCPSQVVSGGSFFTAPVPAVAPLAEKFSQEFSLSSSFASAGTVTPFGFGGAARGAWAGVSSAAWPGQPGAPGTIIIYEYA